VHDRRRDGRDDRECRRRSRAARYLLCRRALPLRAVARRSLRDLRRLVLLVPEDVRVHVLGVLREAALLADVHRREHPVLPAALPWPGRHAAALRRLPGCLRLLELRFLDGFLHYGVRHVDVLRGYGGGLPAQGACSRESMGRGCDDTGVDAVLAAAVPFVRDTASDQGGGAALTRAMGGFGLPVAP